MHEHLIEKQLYFATKQNKILSQNNARLHVALTTRETLMVCNGKYYHTRCIVQLHFHLFHFMQHDLSGTRFRKVEELQKFINNCIHSKKKDFSYRVIHILPEKWRRAKIMLENTLIKNTMLFIIILVKKFSLKSDGNFFIIIL